MPDTDLQQLTAEIVSAHVSNNMVATGDIAGLIKTTYGALADLGAPPAPVEEPKEEFTPAVSVKRSLGSRDRIISMIDGKPYASLKRHLAANGLTPQQYRERYGLKADYPMVAPAYSEKRRDISMRLGLGRKKAPEDAPEQVKGKRGRKPKTMKDATAAAREHLGSAGGD